MVAGLVNCLNAGEEAAKGLLKMNDMARWTECGDGGMKDGRGKVERRR